MPLRLQILISTFALILLATALITFLNVRTAIGRNEQTVQLQLDQISTLLGQSRFPLTERILTDLKKLSSAEFALEERGKITVATDPEFQRLVDPAIRDQARSANLVTFHNTAYSLRTVPVVQTGAPQNLHILLPRESRWQTWWQAAQMPLLAAALVIPLVGILAWIVASAVSRPVDALRRQVEQASSGSRQSIETESWQSEIRQLGISFNQLLQDLERHEQAAVQNAKLGTLVQLGAGLAHNLRNCVTGCQMALQLQPETMADNESHRVAMRQLALMEHHIRRYLSMCESSEQAAAPARQCNATEILGSTIELLKPTAEHLGVELHVPPLTDPAMVNVTADDCEQLFINLINNGIEAASQHEQKHHALPAEVWIELSVNDDEVQFTVRDNGAGPPEELRPKLFEPFVTGKPEGVGLGLALCQRIVKTARGELGWKRENGQTVFMVRLPAFV